MGDIVSSRALDQLTTLDSDLLYVFVAGPGKGEGIAIALPGSGWMIVDGCRSHQGAYPLEQIYRKFRRADEDPIEFLLLTHPHTDHVEGLSELIESYPVHHILVSDINSSHTASKIAERELETSISWSDRAPSQKVTQVLSAMNGWCERNHKSISAIFEGNPINCDHERIQFSCLAPAEAAVREICASKRTLSRRVNELSTVIAVHFGQTVILLGGDMPNRHTNGSLLKYGWQWILDKNPDLHQHHGLKIPHHGSQAALAEDLLTSVTHGRGWWVTPFNSSKLPRSTQEEGLELLLQHEPCIHLSALSARGDRQIAFPPPAQLDIGELRRITDGIRSGNPFIDDAEDIRRGHALEPLDAVWCIAFDNNGNIKQRFRGRAAVEVQATSIKLGG